MQSVEQNTLAIFQWRQRSEGHDELLLLNSWSYEVVQSYCTVDNFNSNLWLYTHNGRKYPEFAWQNAKNIFTGASCSGKPAVEDPFFNWEISFVIF